jgi:hypothetical protein
VSLVLKGPLELVKVRERGRGRKRKRKRKMERGVLEVIELGLVGEKGREKTTGDTK